MQLVTLQQGGWFRGMGGRGPGSDAGTARDGDFDEDDWEEEDHDTGRRRDGLGAEAGLYKLNRVGPYRSA
jgi:hypothetical protein